jgi:hypothetical protein
VTRRLALALVAATLLLAAAPARAQAAWLRDRLDVEWVVATGGWRAAMSASDQHAPGFDALAGGGEFVLGLEVGAGLAVVGDGRVLAGEAGLDLAVTSGSRIFFEALGSLALQLRLGHVRLRAGPTAGTVQWRGNQATLVGGFLATSIDIFPLGGGRLSTTIVVRLDIDADVGAGPLLPDSSAALALGLGVRY